MSWPHRRRGNFDIMSDLKLPKLSCWEHRSRILTGFMDLLLGEADLGEENRERAGPGFKNRGGRPRKDGTRADNSKTLHELGISKRTAAEARLYASVPEDEFEAAMDRCHADMRKGGRLRPLMHYLPDRRANSRHQRETVANIARMVSTARLILAHEFDASAEGELLRRMAERTIEVWTTVTIG